MRSRCAPAAVALLLLAWGGAAAAQPIVLDRPVRAGGLVFFPSVEDAKHFYYAPTSARLARSAGGKPQFSFLRYVENVRSDEEAREGTGGGIVHALVELGVSDAERESAVKELERQFPGAVVDGAAVFRSGRFGLVSSFQADNGELTRQLVGLGTAPILEGNKAAISMQLTVQGTKILWQSFQTATPDVTFMFEMELGGYRAPKTALIEADLDRIYEHQAFAAGVAMTYLQGEITDAFDDLQRSGAIRLTQVGEDESLEPLIASAYSKLTELLFQPESATAAAVAQPGGRTVLDRASERLEQRRREVREENARARQSATAALMASSMARPTTPTAALMESSTGRPVTPTAGLMESSAARPVTSTASPPAEAPGTPGQQVLPDFSAVVTFEMKQSRQRGTYRVDLGKYTADKLSLRFDENIGDLSKYLDDDAVFRNVNLDDPLYRQREVIASLAGVDAGAFEDALSFVSVQLRKKHEDGSETLEELRVDKKAFNEQANRFKLAYGWKGDENRRRWQRYEYRTLWSFASGAPVEEKWRTASFNAIQLAPPYVKRTIQLEGMEAPLKEAKARSVAVTVYSVLPGGERPVTATLNVSRGERSGTLDFLLPAQQLGYDYEIRWRLRGGDNRTTGRQTTDQDILYVDDVPEPEPEPEPAREPAPEPAPEPPPAPPAAPEAPAAGS
jgi:hypothetical protein